MCVCACVHANAMVCMWRPEDSCGESLLSSHPVCPGFMLSDRSLSLPTEPSHWPEFHISALADRYPTLLHRPAQAYMFTLAFFVFCLLVFQDRISLCTDCPGTRSVDQAVLGLRSPCLCLPSAGIKGVRHHHPAHFAQLQR